MLKEMQNLFSHVRETLAIIKDEWKIILIASGGVSLLSLTVPLYMLHLIDHVFMSGQIGNLVGITAVAVLAVLLQWLLQAGRDKMLSAKIQQSQLKNHMANIPALGMPQQRKSLLILVMDFIWLPIFLMTLTFLHPVFGAYALLIALSMIIYETTVLFSRSQSVFPQQNRHGALQALQKKMGSYLSSKTSFQDVYDKSYQLQADHDAQQSDLQANHQSARMGIRILATIGMYAIGAILVSQQQLSAGSVIVAPILLNFILLPIFKMDALSSFFKHEDRKNGDLSNGQIDLRDQAVPQKIRLVNVTHVHKGAVSPLFHDVKLSLELSGICSFSGPAGSGKSQLLRLLSGIDHPARGKVLYDFGNGRRINAHDLKYPVGFLPDQNLFVRGSILDNISLLASMSENDVMVLATELGIHERIMALPEGYESILDPHDHLLSAAERRMLGWMQLFAQQAPVMMIDQPELALDGIFRETIQKKLSALSDQGHAILLASNNRTFTDLAAHRYLITGRQIRPHQQPRPAVEPVRLQTQYAATGGA